MGTIGAFHILVTILISSLLILIILVVHGRPAFIVFGLGLHLKQAPARVVVDVYMELLLVVKLLHSRTVDTNDVSDVRDHRQVFLALRIDDHCRIRGGVLTLVVQGVIHYLYRAYVLSLLCLVRKSCIDYHTEKVEMIHLLHVVDISFSQRGIYIVCLVKSYNEDILSLPFSGHYDVHHRQSRLDGQNENSD